MTSADFGDSSPSSYLTVLKLYTGSRKVGEGWTCVFLPITDPSSFFVLSYLTLNPPPPSHQRVYLSLTYLSVLSVLNILNKMSTHTRLLTRTYSVRKCERRARNVVVTCASAAHNIKLFLFLTTTILMQRCQASFRSHCPCTRGMQEYSANINALQNRYTVKKVQEFPVSSRDVTNQTPPGQE
jgi:hypothetical protein